MVDNSTSLTVYDDDLICGMWKISENMSHHNRCVSMLPERNVHGHAREQSTPSSRQVFGGGLLLTVRVEPRPGFVPRGVPAAMPPGRANGLYVGVVGDGECRPFFRVGRTAQQGRPTVRS